MGIVILEDRVDYDQAGIVFRSDRQYLSCIFTSPFSKYIKNENDPFKHYTNKTNKYTFKARMRRYKMTAYCECSQFRPHDGNSVSNKREMMILV